jgi:hypothetical protein
VASVTDWVGAIGTVGTLVTGVTLFALTLFDRRRSHAAKVATWIDESAEEHGRRWWLHVYNRGEHPIYDCDLHTTGAEPQPSAEWRMA